MKLPNLNPKGKPWEMVVPTKESITKFFEDLRKSFETDPYWDKYKKMEDSLKYFQPEITDIRVGYECLLDGQPETINITDLKNVGRNEELSLETALLDKRIKVPYLTKEQIEAEGYSLTNMNNGMYVKYSGGDLHIYDHNGDTSYLGQCKDINTFRYICKLLNIK